MKIRSGFVSNSSSSSFICDVSGRIESGMDMGISDAEMFRCQNGHTIGNEYRIEVGEPDITDKVKEILSLADDISTFAEAEKKFKKLFQPLYDYKSPKKLKEDLQEIITLNHTDGFDAALESCKELMDDAEEEGRDSDYDVDPACCPICQMTEFSDQNLLSYLIKESGKSIEEIKNEIKLRFSKYDDFIDYIKEK
jgi:hypothetical protein